MNISGLDYNTQRDRLKMPEYGREVQKLVDHALTLSTKAEQQRCAETIVKIMEEMSPQNKGNKDYRHKLWNHLAIISDFKLDIDYPYEIDKSLASGLSPEKVPYPSTKNPVRHYGSLVYRELENLATMPEGPERDALVKLVANQMRFDLVQWSNASSAEERVASDLARLTDGRIQLDLSTFVFNKLARKSSGEKKKKKK